MGDVVSVKEVLDKRRALIYGRGDDERVAELSTALENETLRAGDAVLYDSRSGFLIEKLARQEADDLVLEEVPDVSYNDVGGLDTQIEAITDAVELPYIHRALFGQYELPAPKGILLYGPPGCGKTLVARQLAKALRAREAKLVNGPEIMDK